MWRGRSCFARFGIRALERVKASPERGGAREAGGGGVSSVMRFAHDSSFCGRSLGGFRLCGGEAVAFRSPPPPLRAA